jgi:hypothetical protein
MSKKVTSTYKGVSLAYEIAPDGKLKLPEPPKTQHGKEIYPTGWEFPNINLLKPNE